MIFQFVRLFEIFKRSQLSELLNFDGFVDKFYGFSRIQCVFKRNAEKLCGVNKGSVGS